MTNLPLRNYSKTEKIRSLGFDPQLIPINDLDAYAHPYNREYNKIYNRLLLCKWQGIPAAPLPILPDRSQFPIIIKPIINLYGLSLNCYKVENEEEFYDKYWLNTGFWSPYLRNNSTSTDLIINKGEILWSCTFKGYLRDRKTDKNSIQPGIYDYWEFKPKYRVKNIIRKFVHSFLKGYSGLLNVECIGNKIIEAHLRMGDLDQLVERKVLRAVLEFYNSNFQTWNLKQDFIPHRIYLVPVFIKPDETLKLSEEEVRTLSIGCLFYKIDTNTTAHPPTERRIILLTSQNLDIGLEARKKILEKNANIK